jgi:hypothetical protein
MKTRLRGGISLHTAVNIRRATWQSLECFTQALVVVGDHIFRSIAGAQSWLIIMRSGSGNGKQKTKELWFGPFGSNQFDLRVFSSRSRLV